MAGYSSLLTIVRPAADRVVRRVSKLGLVHRRQSVRLGRGASHSFASSVKYFPYKLITTANGWTGKSPRAEKMAHLRFERACRDYERQLLRVRNRVTSAAWQFFRHGILDEGLHDATLIDMVIGDDIRADTTRTYPWRPESIWRSIFCSRVARKSRSSFIHLTFEHSGSASASNNAAQR
jgi:hypothetical protein